MGLALATSDGYEMRISSLHGFVANFAQGAMKGQLPLSKRELSGEGVEQFGCSAALFSGLYSVLSSC